MAGLFALACACTGSESSPDAGLSERRIFVTNTLQNANLGGIDGADALRGSIAATNATWTASMTPACSTPLRLYCIEQ